MKRPIFGQMVSPAHLEAGAWFLFSRSSRMHLCMALKPDAERPGTDFDFVNLMSFSPEPNIDPQFQCVATSRWVPTVLQLDSVELEIAMDLRSIRTDAAQASDCFKPGAVLISGSDYRLVIAFADQGLHEGLSGSKLA